MPDLSELHYLELMQALDFLLKHIGQSWGVITDAPLAAFLILILGLIGGHLWHRRQIAILYERLKAKDDRLGEYKEKLSGATPDEAVKMIEALQAKVARLTPRRVPKAERSAILEVLRQPPEMKWTIDISWDAPTPDAEQLARDLKIAV